MWSFSPGVKLFVATSPVDFRVGIDGLSCFCRTAFNVDPMNGSVFIFINRSKTSLKVLTYDGQGYWLATKRLSRGRFSLYPDKPPRMLVRLVAEQVHILFRGGDVHDVRLLPEWRRVS